MNDFEAEASFRAELDEPPCYVCGSYFCENFDYCDTPATP